MLTDAVSVAVRYVSSDCAMRIYELLDTHSPTRRYGERSYGIRIQQKLCPLGTPSLQERVGVGLLGLLEPADTDPGEAVAVDHVDFTTEEVQGVRAVDAEWVST